MSDYRHVDSWYGAKALANNLYYNKGKAIYLLPKEESADRVDSGKLLTFVQTDIKIRIGECIEYGDPNCYIPAGAWLRVNSPREWYELEYFTEEDILSKFDMFDHRGNRIAMVF